MCNILEAKISADALNVWCLFHVPQHGIIKDWNDMERIWHFIYSKDQLQTFSEEVSNGQIEVLL